MNQSHDDNSIPSNSPKNTFSSSSPTRFASKAPLLPDQYSSQRGATKRWRIGTALLILFMLVASLWVRPHLADGSKFPIHWGIDGQPNGYGAKNVVLYLLPGIAFLVGVVFELGPLLEPRKLNLQDSLKEFHLMGVATLVILSVCHSILLLAALKVPININAILQPLVGLLFMFLGTRLGKLRSNFLMGIRTPWTLSSEKSWCRTHRLGSKLFFALGAGLWVISFTFSWHAIIWMVFGALFCVSTLVLIIYSYLVWRGEDQKTEV